MDIFRADYTQILSYGFTNGYLFLLLTVSSILDFKYQKIPNFLTFPSMIIGLGSAFLYAGKSGFLFSLAGLALGIFLLIIPYALGGMGAGDVKLLGAVGSFLGPGGVFISFLLTAMAGGLYAIFIILYHRSLFKGYFKGFRDTVLALILTKKYMPEPVIDSKGRPRLCYGIAIALGTGAYLGVKISGYDISLL